MLGAASNQLPIGDGAIGDPHRSARSESLARELFHVSARAYLDEIQALAQRSDQPVAHLIIYADKTGFGTARRDSKVSGGVELISPEPRRSERLLRQVFSKRLKEPTVQANDPRRAPP